MPCRSVGWKIGRAAATTRPSDRQAEAQKLGVARGPWPLQLTGPSHEVYRHHYREVSGIRRGAGGKTFICLRSATFNQCQCLFEFSGVSRRKPDLLPFSREGLLSAPEQQSTATIPYFLGAQLAIATSGRLSRERQRHNFFRVLSSAYRGDLVASVSPNVSCCFPNLTEAIIRNSFTCMSVQHST